MLSRLVLSLTVGACIFCPMAAQGQDNFPDPPENLWLYETVANLKRAGIYFARPAGRHTFASRPYSRAELGEIISSVLQSWHDEHEVMLTLLRRRHSTGTRPRRLQVLVEHAIVLADNAPALGRSIDVLSKELKARGVDLAAEREWVGNAAARLKAIPIGLVRPFPDVRKDHWAADAVEALRREGLLVGYPGGRFGGA